MKTQTSFVALFALATLTAALFTTPCAATEPPAASEEIVDIVEIPAPAVLAIEEQEDSEASDAAPGKRARKGAASRPAGDRDCLRHKRARKARSASRTNTGGLDIDLGPATR